MRSPVIAPRAVLGALRRWLLDFSDARAAVRKARRFRRTKRCRVYICWDLDNTLAASGVLLREGRPLDHAIVVAEPMTNMLAFLRGLHSALPEAEAFFLTARARSLEVASVDWCRSWGLAVSSTTLCLVPSPTCKPRVWAELSRGSLLVIVDDLSLGHETDVIRTYDSLVSEAIRCGAVHVGLHEITSISSGELPIEQAVADVVERLEHQTKMGTQATPAGRTGTSVRDA